MASVRYLVTSLATFGTTVTGIASIGGVPQSFDLDKIPDKIVRAMLPCLIPLPEVGQEQGWQTGTFLGNSPEIDLTLTHLMLVSEAADPGVKKDLPTAIVMLDNYLNAAKTQKFLDTQAGPPYNQVVMKFGIEVGIQTYAGIEYHSVAFKHAYTIYP